MRVGIANDSALATEALRRVIVADARHTISWVARDGEEAVRCCRADRPDVVLMDLVMPVLNGADATRRIMQTCPCAVLVVTSTVAGNFDLVCQALSHGAYDAVCTPPVAGPAAVKAGAELLAKLDRVDRVNHHLACGVMAVPEANGPAAPELAKGAPAPVPLVAIGASTGGPAAVEMILGGWPADFPAALVIAQHIAPEFAGSLAEWLEQRSELTVQLAAAGDRPRVGIALVANGTGHLVLDADRHWSYSPEPHECPYQPSVDVLFHSLAAHWPWPAVAVLLTGIGRDGADGLLALREKGWHTIAQDEATSVVYGMPQAARRLGAACRVLALDRIASDIAERLNHQV
jgi:chemotaxis response regulator CheB